MAAWTYRLRAGNFLVLQLSKGLAHRHGGPSARASVAQRAFPQGLSPKGNLDLGASTTALHCLPAPAAPLTPALPPTSSARSTNVRALLGLGHHIVSFISSGAPLRIRSRSLQLHTFLPPHQRQRASPPENGGICVPDWHCQCELTPPSLCARRLLTCPPAPQPTVNSLSASPCDRERAT